MSADEWGADEIRFIVCYFKIRGGSPIDDRPFTN